MSSELPDGWASQHLSSISKIAMGETLLSKDLTGKGVPVFSANTDSRPWGYTDQNRRTLKRGDIVVGARGSIGFPRLPAFDTFTSTQTTITVEPDASVVDSTYLHAVLCAADIKSLAAQQAVPMLTIGMLAPLSIFLPPLDEQRRIAEVLRSVDEAIACDIEVKEAAEASLDHALAAIIPGPETTEQGWTTTTIGEFATVITGKTPSTKDADLWGGDIPFVTPTDMDGSVRSVRAARSITQAAIKQTKVAPANSVLFTCIASIGKLCLNQEPVAFNQQINACACRDAIDAAFLYWTLRRLTPQIRAMSGTTAVPIVNKTAFSRVSFALPPPASRREIVEVLSSLSEVIESAQRTISSLTELKRRISSDLLSGRVRVPA